MKIKLRDILNGVYAYRELQTIKFPPKTSLTIYKLGKELDRELQSYRDVSKEIYIKYEVPENEAGFDVSKLEEDVRTKLFAELEELADAEVEISSNKISMEELERTNAEISASTIGNLEWAFDFGEEEPVAQTKSEKKKAAKS